MSPTGTDRVIATAAGRDGVIAATSLNEPVPMVAQRHNDRIASGNAPFVTLLVLLAFVRTSSASNHGAGAAGGDERQIAGTRQNALAVAAGAEYRGICVDVYDRVVTLWEMTTASLCRRTRRSCQIMGEWHHLKD